MTVWKLIENESSKHVIGNYLTYKNIQQHFFVLITFMLLILAICSFNQENAHTLAFKLGERLEIIEECDGNLVLNNDSVNEKFL
jgi:hypothetical protein